MKVGHINVPSEIVQQLEAEARRLDCSVVKLTRAFFKLGFIACQAETSEDFSLLVKEGHAEPRELKLDVRGKR